MWSNVSLILTAKRRLAEVPNLMAPALTLLVALTGCTVGPNFQRPSWASPSSWFAGRKEAVKPPKSVPVAQPIDVNWWTLFNDPRLTSLERRVAAENLDVQTCQHPAGRVPRATQHHSRLGVSHSERQFVIRASAAQQQRHVRGGSYRSGCQRCLRQHHRGHQWH